MNYQIIPLYFTCAPVYVRGYDSSWVSYVYGTCVILFTVQYG